ncbi:hypothetical protein C8R43DRAFT_1113645 [Mycena crocata]|nr:hypothetical protein C8R43DRAFT_1113645 [Mycena crocata]
MSTLPTFTSTSTANDVASAFAAEITGKNVLITGTSIGGIGFESARAIAKYAKLVIITGYNAERLELSEDALKAEIPTANIRKLLLDLSSLAAIRKAAETVNNTYPEPLHVGVAFRVLCPPSLTLVQVLIHNAAAPFAPFKLTVDHLENQLATNHVGPFLLTKLLAPKLLASTTPTYTPRVVFVASLAHALGTGVDLDFLAHPDPAKYTMSPVYFQAKSEGGISRGIEGYGCVRSFLLLQKNIIKPLTGMLTPDGNPNRAKWEWKTIPQGAATTVTAAFDPRLDGSSPNKPGAFLDNSNVADESVASQSSDPVMAEKLWTVTEEIIGENFTF